MVSAPLKPFHKDEFYYYCAIERPLWSQWVCVDKHGQEFYIPIDKRPYQIRRYEIVELARQIRQEQLTGKLKTIKNTQSTA